MNNIDILKSSSGITLYSRSAAIKQTNTTIMLSLVIKTGSLCDPDNHLGLAHFVEHMNMIFHKFKLVEFVNSSMSHAYTNYFETVYTFLCVESDLPVVCDLLSQIIDGTYLLQDKIESVREDIIKEYDRVSQSTQHKINKVLFQNSCYYDHFPIGTLEGIQSIQIEDIKSFFHKWYRPERMAIQITGIEDLSYLTHWIEQISLAYDNKQADTAQTCRIMPLNYHLSDKEYGNILINRGRMPFVKLILKIDYKDIIFLSKDEGGIKVKCMLDILSDIIYFTLREHIKKAENEIHCRICDFSEEIIFLPITVDYSFLGEKVRILESLHELGDLVLNWISANYEKLLERYYTLIRKPLQCEKAEDILMRMNLHYIYKRPLFTMEDEKKALGEILNELSLSKLLEYLSILLQKSEKKYMITKYTTQEEL